jgi:hypothetical protein
MCDELHLAASQPPRKSKLNYEILGELGALVVQGFPKK